MENTCIPMADSCQYMAKPIQYCKVKNNNKKNNMSTYFYPHFFLPYIEYN